MSREGRPRSRRPSAPHASFLALRHGRGHIMIRKVGTCLLAGAVATCWCVIGIAAAAADPTGAMSDLTAISGQGTGLVIVSPTSAGRGNFDARVKVNIHDAAPNTTFTVTRAVDMPSDGVCTSTNFSTVATLETSAG